MRQTKTFLRPLFLAFLIVQGSVPAFSADSLRDQSPAESPLKRAGMESALGQPDEDALLDSASTNWQTRIKQGKAVNLEALWASLGSKPVDQADRQGLLNALQGTPAEVFVVPDDLLNGRSAWNGEMGLWIGEEAARQAGAAKLVLALRSGDFSAIPSVKGSEGRVAGAISSAGASKVPTTALRPVKT